MSNYIWGAIFFITILLFVANAVYLHNVDRDCIAQNAPGTTHDWASILDAASTSNQ